MSNNEMVRIAKMIDGHQYKIRKLIERIEKHDWQVAAQLSDECFQPASAEDVVGHFIKKREHTLEAK